MRKQRRSQEKLMQMIVTVLISLGWSPIFAAEHFLVAEWGGNVITRLGDLNGDGDALDIGERILWADAVSEPKSLSILNGSVLVAGGEGKIFRFMDQNRDGDALDAGEKGIFADGFSSSANIVALAGGRTYVSDFSSGEVWQLFDSNGDGDALDLGERTLFASELSGANDIILFQDDLLVSTNFSNQVHQLTDLNGDGDALDVGENKPIAVIDQALVGGTHGLLEDNHGGFFLTSSLNGSIYHAQDLNGDGDMLDAAEFAIYADSVFGSLAAPGALIGTQDGILATDFSLGQVKTIRDRNGDGDGLDIGEQQPFANGLSNPADIVELISAEPPSLLGDFDFDGDRDGKDFLIWQRGGSPNPLSASDLIDWQANYGAVGSLANSHTVPEPATLLLAGMALVGVLRKETTL